MFKIFGFIGIAVFIASLLGGFYWYYQSSQETIAQLSRDNSRLLTVTTIQHDAIQLLEESTERMNQQLVTINRELSDTRQQNRQLVDRLARHDISALARARPGLVERTINNATEQANRCFELLSGAELNEREQNATTAREFNSECPFLFDTFRVR